MSTMKKVIIFLIASFLISGTPLFALEQKGGKKAPPVKLSKPIQKKVVMKKASSAPQKLEKKMKPAKKVISSSKPALKPLQVKPKAVSPVAKAPLAAPVEMNIVYTDEGFSPRLLSVKGGTAITFTNQSSHSLWVASNPHPVHTNYAEFDERASIDKGGKYSFTFGKTGNWKYHNHLNPGMQGEVNVKD